MCGCGIADWCAGGCSCGCDHDTLEGQRSQAQHFARNYKDMSERAIDAFQQGQRAARAEDRELRIADATSGVGHWVECSAKRHDVTAVYVAGQRDTIAKAVAVMEAVHAPYISNLDLDPDARYCESCGTEWPCGTVAAIRALRDE